MYTTTPNSRHNVTRTHDPTPMPRLYPDDNPPARLLASMQHPIRTKQAPGHTAQEDCERAAQAPTTQMITLSHFLRFTAAFRHWGAPQIQRPTSLLPGQPPPSLFGYSRPHTAQDTRIGVYWCEYPVGTELTPRAGIAPLGAGQVEQAVPEARRSVPVNPGPYGDEEVLFNLQLLAYLSKYPHMQATNPSLLLRLSATTQSPNVFSLVERFTFCPSPSETTLPRLPHEIQYWAEVIMRNACRKDDQRGGIRQCANMLCDRWEDFPRKFAKCRRCQKAKYCGKECQSKAWAEGHRFWCSAREEDDSSPVARM
ncbi:hypothetical protein FRC11_003931 [Ceratobasidium sp. 423]|nr:hypothetical protein FRC11_003931 [Ceratobasidium sp. 423]